MFKLITLIVISALFTVGCSTTKTTELTVANKEVIYVTVPDALLGDCLPDAPMDTKQYMSLTLDERELSLSKYIITLYGTIAVCNTQIQNIKKLNSKVGTP